MTIPRHQRRRAWRLAIAACGLAIGLVASTAQADHALIERTHAETKAIQADLVGQEGDFDELLTLRARIEPLRDELREQVAQFAKARDEAKARLTDLGPEPAAPAPPEPAEVARARHDLRTAFAATDVDYREAQVALAGADALWTHLTDLRRDAFADQIFHRAASPFTPTFWTRLVAHGVPATLTRARKVYDDEVARVIADGGAKSLAILTSVFVGAICLFFGLHAWLARRAAANVGAVAGVFERRAAIRQAFFVLVMRSLPLPLMVMVLDAAIEYFDLSSDNVDLLVERVVIAVLMISVSRGIMAALLSPTKPHARVVACSDETAETLYGATILAANIFVLGILMTAFEDIVSAPTSLIMTTSFGVASGIIVVAGHALFRLRGRPMAAETEATIPRGADAALENGPIVLTLGWVRPLVVLVLVTGLVAMAAGYVTFAGFLMSRLTLVVLVVALAILLSLFIEEAFGNVLTSRSPVGHAVARAIGLEPEALEVVSTILAGLLRLAVVCVALIFAFGPWGIRFGDVNPFDDALFAFSFAYVRFSLGTVSFALLCFVVGLLGTRLIVGWLDRRLLPLTALDLGVRNSMTTVLGYVGFAVTMAVVLSQLGVNPQNLTVVAGALSVGIGFGLQAITSNFISGLIVLAERPIRVGDVVGVKGEEGRVKKISVRSTLIAGFDKTDIIVPNTDILTSIVRNRSLSDREGRLRITILVDHEADQDDVDRILLASALDHDHVVEEPAPMVFFSAVSDAGLEFELRCFIDDLDNTDRVRSDLNFQITRRFRAAGIRLASTAWRPRAAD